MKALKICPVIILMLLLFGCKGVQKPMNYQFTTTNTTEDLSGTSKITGFGATSGEEETRIQGQLISLFGSPLSSSPDVENAYSYTIHATDSSGNQFLLRVYDGPSGAAIGGNAQVLGIRETAAALKEYIQKAIPADFVYEGYYLDGPTKIRREIQNGTVHYSESELTEAEAEKAMEICYPNIP